MLEAEYQENIGYVFQVLHVSGDIRSFHSCVQESAAVLTFLLFQNATFLPGGAEISGARVTVRVFFC